MSDIDNLSPTPAEAGAAPIALFWKVPILAETRSERPELSADIRNALLSPAGEKSAALVGQGGSGKTVLAQMLAHDPLVRTHFKDGVYWVSLGGEPDLLPLLGDLIQIFDPAFMCSTLSIASAHLKRLLAERQVLFILDDVRELEHLRPFLGWGEQRRLLLTTRQREVAASAARLCFLDAMTPVQAMALLESSSARTLDPTERPYALQIAEMVGFLPLTLSLVAGRSQAGVLWQELAEALRKENAQVEAREEPERLLNRAEGPVSLEAALRVTLRALQAVSPQSHALFAWFGALPEQAILTPPMMAVVWQREIREAQELLKRFWQEGLLLAATPLRIQGENYPCYRLHDLIHSMAHRLLSAESQEGLGLLPTEAHRILLERYWSRLPLSSEGERFWSQLADDGYILDHLTWHMEQAEQPEAIFLLLQEEEADGRSAWEEAKYRLGKMAGYMEDVKRSWRGVQRRSRAAAERGEPITTLVLELRHCLMLAGMNIRSNYMSADWLVDQVQSGRWPLHIGLLCIRRMKMSDSWTGAKALSSVIPYLTAEAAHEIVAIMQMTADETEREWVIAEVAQARNTAGDTGQALRIARILADASKRAEVLTEIADTLTISEERSLALAEALASARQIEDAYALGEALVGILPGLTTLGDTEQALTLARTIEDGYTCVQALMGIAGSMPEAEKRSPVWEEALATARALEDAYERAWSLNEILGDLPQSEEKSQIMREALAVARTITDLDNRANALTAIIFHLPPSEERSQAVVEALANAHQIQVQDAFRGLRLLTSLANTLASVGETKQALSIARSMELRTDCRSTLQGIAERLPESEERKRILAEAEESVQREKHAVAAEKKLTGNSVDSSRAMKRFQEVAEKRKLILEAPGYAYALPGIVNSLAASGDIELALALARTIPEALMGGDVRTEALTGIINVLVVAGDIEQAIEIARTIESEYYLGRAFAGFAEYLTAAQRNEVLSIAQTNMRADSRAQALIDIAPYLSADQLEEALAIVPTIHDAFGSRMRALTGIIKALAAFGKTDRALAMARAMQDSRERPHALSEIAGELTEAQLREALMLVREISSPYDKAGPLAVIAVHLPQAEERSEVLAEAFAAVSQIERESDRARMFAEIGRRMPSVEERSLALAEGLAAARAVPDEKERMEALIKISGHLPPGDERSQVFAEALSAARRVKDVYYRGWPRRLEAFSDLAQALAAVGEAEQALSVAWLAHDPAARDQPLTRGWSHEENLLRENLLATVAAGLRYAPTADFYALWTSLLQLCALQSHSSIMKTISHLAPLVWKHGSRRAIEDLLEALM